MSPRTRGESFGAAIALPLLLACLVAQPGCEGESPVSCKACPELDFTSGLYGLVTGAGVPILLELQADNRIDWESGTAAQRVIAGTRTDSTGFFSIPLPGGVYELKYRYREGSSSWTGFFGEEGGLHVEPQAIAVPDSVPLRLDVALNEVRVTVQGPPEWEEQSLFTEPRTAMLRLPPHVEPGRTVYRLFGLPEDLYRFGVSNLQGKLWLPPAYRREDAPRTRVDGMGVDEIEFAIPSAGHLQGFLRGCWLEMALPPPDIMSPYLGVCWTDSLPPIMSASSDTSTGWFSFDVFAPLPRVRVMVRFEEWTDWYGGGGFEEAEIFDLDAGRDTRLDIIGRGIEVQIPGEEIFAVLLVDSTMKAIRGHSSTWTSWWLDRHYSSDRVPIPGLLPGTYFVRIQERPGRWPAHWYRAALSFDRAAPILLRQDDVVIRVLADSLPPP